MVIRHFFSIFVSYKQFHVYNGLMCIGIFYHE